MIATAACDSSPRQGGKIALGQQSQANHPLQKQHQNKHQLKYSQQKQHSDSVRIILSRDEVNHLFGCDEVLLNQLRQETGADIVLTDPCCSEQVLTISSNSLELIFDTFGLVCRKLCDLWRGRMLLRLAVPASQCGSVIGKHGARVKEIRDLTGASIQVQSDSLPESTERCVEISGTGKACLECAFHVCCILQEAPLRGNVVPYTPKSDVWKPVFLCGDKAYVVEGGVAVPAPPDLLRRELAKTPLGEKMAITESPVDNNNGCPLNKKRDLQVRNEEPQQISKDISVDADMIGVIIGKRGVRITEIRRVSGAQLHIKQDIVTITGTEEAITMAQFLIQSSIEVAVRERAREEMGGSVAKRRGDNIAGGKLRF